MQNETLDNGKRILCLWLPNWPIQRLIAAQPELRRQRVVLFRQDSRRGQLVAAVSPLAQRDGVQVDMPLSESKSLLTRSANRNKRTKQETGFHILPHDPAADLYAIQKLADDLDTFSPIVGLQQETAQPDCVFLDITGLGHLFGSESGLTREVETHCRERGYLTRLAIAHTVGLAQGMAQFADLKTEDLKTAELNSYNSLPVPALRLSDWIVETLGQLGVRTIGQLLQLPRQDLSARFGAEIHRRIDQFTGRIAEPIIARRQPPEFYAEQLLDYPTSHKETIEVIMQRLIATICDQLSARQQGALQWTIRLYVDLNSGSSKLPLKLHVSLFQPTAAAEDVIGLAKMQLEQILQPRENLQGSGKRRLYPVKLKLDGQPLQVNEITVAVTSCALLKHRQRKLFDENPRLDRQALAHLINRLSGRLGRHQVVYPTIVAGAQPEHAYKFRPLVDPHRQHRRQATTKTAGPGNSHAMARPLKLLQLPVELKTLKVPRQLPPALFSLNDQQHTVVHWWGPERIETGWWRGPTTRRDYWRVETRTHHQFWIYRDLRSRKWFLHGEF